MLCTGCGTQPADHDLFCGNCVSTHIPPPLPRETRAIFYVGQAMREETSPRPGNRRYRGMLGMVVVAIVGIGLLIAYR